VHTWAPEGRYPRDRANVVSGANVGVEATTEGSTMSPTDIHAEHTTAEHQHGEGCGHEAVPHEDHVDYVHDGHKHAVHDDHYDEH
jgi:hypothetical protein